MDKTWNAAADKNDDQIAEMERFLRERITQLRLKSDLSEYQLSLELGKCKTYIQSISSGKAMPSLGAFFEICVFFHLTPEQFFATVEEDAEQLRSIYGLVGSFPESDLKLLEALLLRFKETQSGR